MPVSTEESTYRNTETGTVK